MKKIASLILAGAMLLSGFLMPMQVKAESIVVNAKDSSFFPSIHKVTHK